MGDCGLDSSGSEYMLVNMGINLKAAQNEGNFLLAG